MKEIIEINNHTGEILLSSNPDEVNTIRQTKIKVLNLLNKDDFVLINGTWEAKRSGLIKILSSLPISYAWEIKDKHLTHTHASITGVLTISTGSIKRQSDSVGICEMDEIKGTKSLHFMVTRAETRALKRSIEVLFGSVINWYVGKYLIK
ncbi:hypothetical protein [Aliarcobacter cryaerophilus]|uniref:hypothetical protein n=1 Tax=Aliarcobacter cryaerophilus TaxID=28198 RepID=UPI0021B6039D|nr:hypothetical protein [Aliarcobacter cryaerophilus]MCT7530435.1 hypothetical protein [Aliarcobacter cryaerophilus]